MARPARPWFRFYVEAVHDRKLRKRPPAQRWLWATMMAAARESPRPGLLLDELGEPMTDADIADYAGVPRRDVVQALPLFERADMITRDDDTGAWRLVNWGRRQFESDDTTRRTAKHRSKERDGNVPRNGLPPFLGTGDERSEERSSSRALMTETETETDPPPSPSDSRPAADEPDGEGGQDLVEQAVQLAARRYADHQITQGQGRSVEGLTRYWLQENAEGARVRAGLLLAEYDLSLTQLADALGHATAPRWLANHRRRRPLAAVPDPQETHNHG